MQRVSIEVCGREVELSLASFQTTHIYPHIDSDGISRENFYPPNP